MRRVISGGFGKDDQSGRYDNEPKKLISPTATTKTIFNAFLPRY